MSDKQYAEVSIGRVSSNVSEDMVSIRVIDTKSRTEFLSLTFTLKDFALALLNLSHVEAEMSLRQLDRVGKNRFTKDVTFVTDKIKTIPQEILEAEANDGWTPLTYDMNNSKNYNHDWETGKIHGNVTFVKYE